VRLEVLFGSALERIISKLSSSSLSIMPTVFNSCMNSFSLMTPFESLSQLENYFFSLLKNFSWFINAKSKIILVNLSKCISLLDLLFISFFLRLASSLVIFLGLTPFALVGRKLLFYACSD